jgi:hypothetical protein
MYDLTFAWNGHFNKKNEPKETCIFHALCFSKNEHPFGQCGHFNQVKPFEKPWFLVVIFKVHCHKIVL